MKLLSLIITIIVLSVSLVIGVSAKQSSQTPLTPALSVISLNLEMKKSGLVDNPLYFSENDFEEFLGVKSLKSVTVTALPSVFEGTLYLENTPVVANQTVHRTDLDKLRFVPASNEISNAAFCFYGNGMSCETSIKCSLYLFNEINTAPVITQDVFENEKLTTNQNIMVYSKLYAEDAENDALVFEVSEEPKHGIVTFIDKANGKFTYTPATDYVGKDRFTYTVSDEYGNRSEKASVEIKVERQIEETFYSDMLRHSEHNAAIKATEYNIMSGKIVNGKLCFLPDSTPTKAEFVTMAMKAAGYDYKYNVTEVGFTDDNDIPASYMGYIAYALESEFISGTKTEQGVFFYPNSPITRAEAAVILNNILKAEEGEQRIEFVDSNDIPSWAEEDISALAQLKVMEALSDGSYMPNSNVTNAQAATILSKVYEIKKK